MELEAALAGKLTASPVENNVQVFIMELVLTF